ncbi:hypothetical protein [Burkholderia ubonensis]|uniref:hypothetical protein n=1 Tax=Burkholderia ubonensis TaxID=101571 RepID=UPI000B22092B|nr:hypothetical protein [Burkholderia ubonensis]
MNDQQHSRADALTEERRQALGEALTEYFATLDSDAGIRAQNGRILRTFDSCDSRNIDDMIDRAIVPALAASPVEQPAAAPADERAAFIEAYVLTLPQENREVDPDAARRFAESVITACGPSWQLWQAGIAYARAAASPAAEEDNSITLDRRDLFDFVRGAIKSTLQDYKAGEGMTPSWYWQEATNRTEAVLEALDTKSPYIEAAPQPAQADAPAEAREPARHEWDATGERCVKCGDKDWFADPHCSESRIKGSAPADAGEPIGQHDLSTSTGGRAYIAEFFAKRLRRHDFGRYITGQLAADFACALAAYLRGHDRAPADAGEAREPHSDDVAVDSFAAVMKHKLALARDKGRGGWETCSPADLSRMLREHVEKGDPRDVANFCMMLWHHGSPIVITSHAARVESLTANQRSAIKQAQQLAGAMGYPGVESILGALLNGADQ